MPSHVHTVVIKKALMTDKYSKTRRERHNLSTRKCYGPLNISDVTEKRCQHILYLVRKLSVKNTDFWLRPSRIRSINSQTQHSLRSFDLSGNFLFALPHISNNLTETAETFDFI